jgi:peptide/nickel transport system permease protein
MAGFWRRFVRNRSAVLGLAILAAVLLMAAAAPLFYPGTPFALAGKPLSGPFGGFLFGTDTLGRDVAAGIAHGARTSLLIGLISTSVAVLLGVPLAGSPAITAARLTTR